MVIIMLLTKRRCHCVVRSATTNEKNNNLDGKCSVATAAIHIKKP